MNIKYEHVEILREGLAKVFKSVPRTAQEQIVGVLRNYGKAIAPYCSHPKMVEVPRERALACLDCGMRKPI